MKYKTLENSIASQLDIEIEQHLELGWQLHGSQYYTGFRYVQVVTLENQ